MSNLLKLAHLIDALNERVGRIATWLILIVCLISAGNALSRYLFHISSNAWLEIQWYMFAGIVMLGAAVTFQLNEHVRVDIFYSRLPPRRRAWLDLLGTVFFLLPAAALMAWMAWPAFVNALVTGEMSGDAGGLIRWPALLMLPLGFALLTLQGISEIIKRVGYLRGEYDMDTHYERPLH
jgi:TRAP-type mannitol/chloroaromatic compound transport system permease small subunit